MGPAQSPSWLAPKTVDFEGYSQTDKPIPALCLVSRGKCGICIFQCAPRHLIDLCGRCYLSFRFMYYYSTAWGWEKTACAWRLRKGRLGNFPWKTSMMSKVAGNLTKVQGLMSRRPRPSLGVVWGRRQEGGGTETQKESHGRLYVPFILTTSLRVKGSHLYFAKR